MEDENRGVMAVQGPKERTTVEEIAEPQSVRSILRHPHFMKISDATGAESNTAAETVLAPDGPFQRQ